MKTKVIKSLDQADKKKTIFQSEFTRIDYFYREKNSKLAFIFSNQVISDLDGNHSGGNFLFQNSFDVINFKNINLDWFQNLPNEIFNKIEAALIKKYDSRVAMGHSMGGYASIAFSGIFNFDIALSFAPQHEFTLNDDFRFLEDFKKNSNWPYAISGKTVSKSCKYYIVYDRCDLDIIHINKLNEILPAQNTTEIALPYASHEVTGYLHEIGLLKNLSLAILSGNPISDLNLRKNRLKSKRYFEAICASLLKKGRKKELIKLEAIIKKFIDKNSGKVISEKLTNNDHSLIYENQHLINLLDELSIKIARCNLMNELSTQGFDEEFYLKEYPDVALANMPAIYHYVCFGQYERRKTRFLNAME